MTAEKIFSVPANSGLQNGSRRMIVNNKDVAMGSYLPVVRFVFVPYVKFCPVFMINNFLTGEFGEEHEIPDTFLPKKSGDCVNFVSPLLRESGRRLILRVKIVYFFSKTSPGSFGVTIIRSEKTSDPDFEVFLFSAIFFKWLKENMRMPYDMFLSKPGGVSDTLVARKCCL